MLPMPEVAALRRLTEGDEMCPICRSSTYLNPNMRFLVNLECYHKICESCVNRIFGSGPAPCPYLNCGKRLRRQRFKSQIFEDLRVEREVDVRQRVTKIYNQPESSFKSAREYDDYLEHIETLVFTLSGPEGAEKQEAEEEIREHERIHKQEILENALKQRHMQLMEEDLQKQNSERERRLRMLALELQNQEREYKRIMQQETVNSLAAGQDADLALREAADRAKKRTEMLRNQYSLELNRSKYATKNAVSLGTVVEASENSTPFTPFDGDRSIFPFKLQQSYFDPLTSQFNTDPTLRAGGFTPQLAELSALATAFMSLEVDIQSEKVITI